MTIAVETIPITNKEGVTANESVYVFKEVTDSIFETAMSSLKNSQNQYVLDKLIYIHADANLSEWTGRYVLINASFIYKVNYAVNNGSAPTDTATIDYLAATILNKIIIFTVGYNNLERFYRCRRFDGVTASRIPFNQPCLRFNNCIFINAAEDSSHRNFLIVGGFDNCSATSTPEANANFKLFVGYGVSLKNVSNTPRGYPIAFGSGDANFIRDFSVMQRSKLSTNSSIDCQGGEELILNNNELLITHEKKFNFFLDENENGEETILVIAGPDRERFFGKTDADVTKITYVRSGTTRGDRTAYGVSFKKVQFFPAIENVNIRCYDSRDTNAAQRNDCDYDNKDFSSNTYTLSDSEGKALIMITANTFLINANNDANSSEVIQRLTGQESIVRVFGYEIVKQTEQIETSSDSDSSASPVNLQKIDLVTNTKTDIEAVTELEDLTELLESLHVLGINATTRNNPQSEKYYTQSGETLKFSSNLIRKKDASATKAVEYTKSTDTISINQKNTTLQKTDAINKIETTKTSVAQNDVLTDFHYEFVNSSSVTIKTIELEALNIVDTPTVRFFEENADATGRDEIFSFEDVTALPQFIEVEDNTKTHLRIEYRANNITVKKSEYFNNKITLDLSLNVLTATEITTFAAEVAANTIAMTIEAGKIQTKGAIDFKRLVYLNEQQIESERQAANDTLISYEKYFELSNSSTVIAKVGLTANALSQTTFQGFTLQILDTETLSDYSSLGISVINSTSILFLFTGVSSGERIYLENSSDSSDTKTIIVNDATALTTLDIDTAYKFKACKLGYLNATASFDTTNVTNQAIAYNRISENLTIAAKTTVEQTAFATLEIKKMKLTKDNPSLVNFYNFLANADFYDSDVDSAQILTVYLDDRIRVNYLTSLIPDLSDIQKTNDESLSLNFRVEDTNGDTIQVGAINSTYQYVSVSGLETVETNVSSIKNELANVKTNVDEINTTTKQNREFITETNENTQQ